MVRIVLVGSDHRLVPLSRLEELASRCEQIQAGLLELGRRRVLLGALLLSTCNRLEILAEVQDDDGPLRLRALLGCPPSFPVRHLDDAAAVAHLLEVATGLASMVFGEEQILGQVRRSFKTAEELGLLSRRLHMLRSRLLSAARDVRHRAGLDHRPRSVAALAVEQVVGAGPRIAVVGAGETGRLALETLRRRHVERPLIVNRTFAKAAALARHFDGQAMSLPDFLQERPHLDGVVLAVRGCGPLLSPQGAAGLKVVADVSQPSVLAPGLRDVAGLRVFDLDDLATVAERERAEYANAKAAASTLVHALARDLWREVSAGRPNLGRVVDLHVEGALAELEQAFHGSLSHLGEQDRDALRTVLLRAARRNAHFHIQDIRHLAAVR